MHLIIFIYTVREKKNASIIFRVWARGNLSSTDRPLSLGPSVPPPCPTYHRPFHGMQIPPGTTRDVKNEISRSFGPFLSWLPRDKLALSPLFSVFSVSVRVILGKVKVDALDKGCSGSVFRVKVDDLLCLQQKTRHKTQYKTIIIQEYMMRQKEQTRLCMMKIWKMNI